jgi:hypothetical protein
MKFSSKFGLYHDKTISETSFHIKVQHLLNQLNAQSTSTNVPSSGRTKCQFQEAVASDVNLCLINVNNEAATD